MENLLPSARAPTVTNLEVVKLSFELLDSAVSHLQILIETITLSNKLDESNSISTRICIAVSQAAYVLLPLPEPGFFSLDLLGKALPKLFLLFFEFRVIQLLNLGFTELPRFHLLLTVVLVVEVLRSSDEVKHVSTDKQRPQFLEVAVVLVLDFSHPPEVLTTLDNATIECLDILR